MSHVSNWCFEIEGRFFAYRLRLVFSQLSFSCLQPVWVLRHLQPPLPSKKKASIVNKRSSVMSRKARIASKETPKHNCKLRIPIVCRKLPTTRKMLHPSESRFVHRTQGSKSIHRESVTSQLQHPLRDPSPKFTAESITVCPGCDPLSGSCAAISCHKPCCSNIQPDRTCSISGGLNSVEVSWRNLQGTGCVVRGKRSRRARNPEKFKVTKK